MIIVVTGNGKGKTTSAIGQIIRALGHNQKVFLIQLFKGNAFYGEQNILMQIDNLDFFSYAKEHPYCIKTTTKEEVIEGCSEAMKKLKEISESPRKYDLIVLEEFNIALRDGFIDKGEFIDTVKKISKNTNVYITGRGAPKEIINLADLVTEMKEIKHPFQKGEKAKEGIEF